MRRVFEQALDRLRSAVCLRPLRLPESFNDVLTLHRRINVVEAAAYHRATFPSRRDQYGPKVSALLEEGHTVSAVDYSEALIRREALRGDLARLLHEHEDALGCLVMPATVVPAPGLDTTGEPTFNAPWSYIGWPSLTIPIGLVDGLPIGMQFIAMTVPQVFAMAGLCERVLGFHERPQLMGGVK
jgi:aspartyl-tRNA(Asn)/glutamyl-tRNA(Gln) amidotransferase subunit A